MQEPENYIKKNWWQRNKDWFLDFHVVKNAEGKIVPTRSFLEKASVVVLLLFVDLIYCGIVVQFLSWLFGAHWVEKWFYWSWASGSSVMDRIIESLQWNLGVTILFAVILAPLWEEFAFRRYWLGKKLRKIDNSD